MATACPITPWTTDRPGFPLGNRYPEAASQTFLAGTPVFLSSGYVTAVTTSFGGTETILGIAAEAGHNLASSGTGEDTNEYGSPVGMPDAVISAHGSPLKDGDVQVIHARNIVFRAALTDGQTYSAALAIPNTRYELALEANGYWSVDSTDTGTGNDHVVEIVGPDPNSTEHVLFRFYEARTANV